MSDGYDNLRKVPLFIDIETVPTQSDEHKEFLTSHVKPAANIKDPDKIEADLAKKRAAIIPQTALNGLWGEIVSIAWAVGDGNIASVSRTPYVLGSRNNEYRQHYPEREFLRETSIAISSQLGLQRPQWVGFNLGFDTSFLFKRCCLLGIEFLPHIPNNEPPWSDKVLDLQFTWAGREIKGQSLGNIAHAFGFEPKTMDPTEIEFYWHQGERKLIEEYNAHDVELTRDLYYRLEAVGAFR